MYDDFHRAVEDLSKLSDKDRTYATTWLVVWCILFILRYVVTGVVVFMLGRRIIAAFAMALKEANQKEGRR